MKTPIIIALLLLLVITALQAQVPSTMSYQGRILQNGQPFEGKGYFVFALYEGPDRIWTNKYPASSQLNDPQYAVAADAMELEVRNGIFSVQLGKAGISNNRPLLLEQFYEANETPKRVRANLRMEVWFSPDPNQTFKKLSPDIEFASVPFAQVAELARTVADGAVGTAQLANGQVTTEKTAEKVSSALNPPGTILTYAGAVTDTGALIEPVPGYLLCNGAVIDGAASGGKFDALRTVLGTSWGDGSDSNAQTVNLPDLRGMFLRGASGLRTDRDQDRGSRIAINNGAAIGNNVGSYQTHSFKSHNHTGSTGNWNSGFAGQVDGRIRWWAGWDASSDGGSGQNEVNDIRSLDLAHTHSIPFDGGSETRPINTYVNYIIKY